MNKHRAQALLKLIAGLLKKKINSLHITMSHNKLLNLLLVFWWRRHQGLKWDMVGGRTLSGVTVQHWSLMTPGKHLLWKSPFSGNQEVWCTETASCHGQIQSFQAEGAGKESRQGTDFSVGSLMKFWTLIRAPMLSSMLTSSMWTGSSTTTQPHSLVVLMPLQITISYIFLSSSSINIFLTY